MPTLSSLKLAALALLIPHLSGIVRGADVPVGNDLGGGPIKGALNKTGQGEDSSPHIGEDIKDVLTSRQGAWERQFRVLVLIKFSIST
jgi:hypothetical protein